MAQGLLLSPPVTLISHGNPPKQCVCRYKVSQRSGQLQRIEMHYLAILFLLLIAEPVDYFGIDEVIYFLQTFFCETM